jgi:hypothetical protein
MDTPPSVDRAALAAEWEEARHAFHALLLALPATARRAPDAAPGWDAAAVLWHIALVAEASPREAALLRRAWWLLAPAAPLIARLEFPLAALFDRAQERLVRQVARRGTRGALARRYEAAHARGLAALSRVGADDWAKGARYPAVAGGPQDVTGRVTVAALFYYHPRHLAAHAAQLLDMGEV